MRSSIRRTLLAGATAGLSLTLVAPAVSANASELHRSASEHRSAVHHKHSTTAATQKAMRTLRQALRVANAKYRLDVRAARIAFATATAPARAARDAVVSASTVPADIVAAWHA